MIKRKPERPTQKKYIPKFYLKPEEKERLMEVKKLLEENLSRHYTIPQLSKRALMNEFKLKKGFRLLFAKSIHDFHFELRIKEAEKLLCTTSYPLEDIAEKTGYYYVSSFIVAFKSYYKITPASFRRNCLEYE